MATASKAKRVAGIVALMLAGLFVILFGWIFVAERSMPTPIGLHSFGKVDVDAWDQGLVLAEGTWRAERKPERILWLTLSKPPCARQGSYMGGRLEVAALCGAQILSEQRLRQTRARRRMAADGRSGHAYQ